MKRAALAAILTGAIGMGLSKDVQAQVLIMPTGPLFVRSRAEADVQDSDAIISKSDNFYPGRTMGGGTRILRSIPPPSSLKRRKE